MTSMKLKTDVQYLHLGCVSCGDQINSRHPIPFSTKVYIYYNLHATCRKRRYYEKLGKNLLKYYIQNEPFYALKATHIILFLTDKDNVTTSHKYLRHVIGQRCFTRLSLINQVHRLLCKTFVNQLIYHHCIVINDNK